MAEAFLTLVPAPAELRIDPGDTITSFRGVNWVFVRVSRPAEPGKQAKVLVKDPEDGHQMEFYASVFPGLEVR